MGDAALGLLCSAVAYLSTSCVLLLAGLAPSEAVQSLCNGLALAGACLAWRRPGSWALALPSCAICLAVSQANPARAGPPFPAPSPRAIQAEVTVLSVRRTSWGELRLRVRTDAGSSMAVQSRFHAPVRPGDRLQLWGRATASTSGWFLERAIWRPIAATQSTPLTSVLAPAWRDRTQSWITRQFPQPAAAWAQALLLGESYAAPFEQRRSYRDLGLLHLLSISGMHFWVWSALLRRLLPSPLRWLRWPLLFTLAFLAEFSPAVVRAGVALALRDACARRGLAVSPWSLWSAAMAVELMRSSRPSLGFLLSYSATAGLLLARPPRASPLLTRALVPSAAAALCTAPILHARQATLEFWSIPCTPLFAAILPLRMLCVAGALIPPFRVGLNHILISLDSIEQLLLDQLARLPGTPWVLPQLSSPAVGVACLIVLAALLARAGRARVRWALGVGALALIVRLDARDPAGWAWTPNWVIFADSQGTALFPRHARARVDGFGLDRELLPALARARAHGPWFVAFLDPEKRAQLQRRIPVRELDSVCAQGTTLRALPFAAGWRGRGQAGEWVVLDPTQTIRAFDLYHELPALRPRHVFAPRPKELELDLAWLESQWQVGSWHRPE